MTESFEYKGHTFRPLGNILGGWLKKTGCTTWAYTLKIEGYTHKDFYKVAKKHKASVDLFEVDGKIYIPTEGVLLGVTDNYKKTFKPIEEYGRWYQ